MNIGTKIRNLRLGNNLTQEELADRLDLTKGYISQLENNLTSPSIQTLFQILETLGTDVNEFFSKDADEQIAFKKSEFRVEEDENLRTVTSWIVPNEVQFGMQPIIIELESGGQSPIEDAHVGEEFGYVLEGSIILVLGKKRVPVRKGETFYFRANKEHFIINYGSKKAKVLWVSTPPSF